MTISDRNFDKSLIRGRQFARKFHTPRDSHPAKPVRYGSSLTHDRRPAAIRSRPLSIQVARPRRLMNSLLIERANKHLTQRQLAEAVGISPNALSAIECGKSVPSVGTALVLAEVLEVSVHDIFYLDTLRDVEPSNRWR